MKPIILAVALLSLLLIPGISFPGEGDDAGTAEGTPAPETIPTPGPAMEPAPGKAEGAEGEEQPRAPEPAVEADAGEVTPEPAAIPAREATDPSAPIEVTIGEEFDIVHDANPTTGYVWRIAGSVDESVVQLVGTVYEPEDAQRAGGGGKRVWTFRGTGPGKTTLSFEYLRPWERKQRPVKTETLVVIVR